MGKITAVIPAAGMGTRLFPLTYAVPKELLPLGPKPTIQLVVEELLAAGVQDFVIVIGKRKEAIAEHFTALRQASPLFAEENVRISYAVQAEPKGLGDAVLCAKDHVCGDFVVALGDAVIGGSSFGGLMQRLLQVHAEAGAAAVVAAQQVSLADTGRYGILRPGEAGPAGSVRVLDLVEKPGPERAPSTLAICARYVLSDTVFDILSKLAPGHGAEVQLTDALQVLAREYKAYAVPLAEGEERWDVGSLRGYGQACLKAWQAWPEFST